MFKAHRRTYCGEGNHYQKTDKGYDLGYEWVKDDSLDKEFERLPENCDFYVVRRWFLKCACAPCLELMVDKESVRGYIEINLLAGDLIEIWAVTENKVTYISAKMPDEDGLIPVKGTY